MSESLKFDEPKHEELLTDLSLTSLISELKSLKSDLDEIDPNDSNSGKVKDIEEKIIRINQEISKRGTYEQI